MSIKGIDSQIMIARTTDFARETSALQKKPEIVQDYLAVREKIAEAQQQTRVAKTLETEPTKLHPDDDGGGGGGYGGEAEHGGDEIDEEIDEDMLVPPGNNVIDIKI